MNKAPAGEHEYKVDIKVDVFYPDHPSRTESSIFVATRRHWHSIGAVCIVCKAMQKIEIHHKYIEWADAGGVDWEQSSRRTSWFRLVGFQEVS